MKRFLTPVPEPRERSEPVRENKILSQQEIEALTAALEAESDPPAPGAPVEVSPPAKVAKVYDFRRPDKFSKEHLRALRILHESFARMMASSLTSYLSTAVQVRLTMLEQVTYEEYVQSLPTPTVVYIVGLAPLSGQAVVEINLPVARTIMDRLLGGSGILSDRRTEMTEIEMTLLKTIGNFLTAGLRETWTSIIPLRPTIKEPVLSPDLAQFAILGESTVMLVLEISLFKTTGTLSMCLPYPVIQPVMDALTSHVWLGGAKTLDTEDSKLDVREQLDGITVPLTTDLGRADITVRELVSLSPGQVLRLNTFANGQLPVRVGDHVKFSGLPGLNGKNLAIQIVQTLA